LVRPLEQPSDGPEVALDIEEARLRSIRELQALSEQLREMERRRAKQTSVSRVI